MMDKKNLTNVALRHRAVFLDIKREDINMRSEITVPVAALIRLLHENGYSVSEELLHALNSVSPNRLVVIVECINEVYGLDLNWAPLVKEWNVPTGETAADHLVTFIVNLFFGKESGFKGTTLPCGHFIPQGTFPLKRYNGCPFCGKPFKTADFVYKGQGSKLKELRLFTVEDMEHLFSSLLASTTPLNYTQQDSLELLLREFPLPENPKITMKETAMQVVQMLAKQDMADEASKLLKTPNDVLRYLWYEKIGYVQLIEPRTLVTHARKLYPYIWGPIGWADAGEKMKSKLMLKYDRKACRCAARWMNAIPLTAKQAAENMNPKRGMWVRMIHALRLGEYSRKKGFEHLAEILDVFYKQDYTTWQGRVDKARKANDADKTLALLKERPGFFARCLFASMLRFGSDKTLAAFNEIADKLPARLLLSLGNAAEIYFDPKEERVVRPITGVMKAIEHNKLLVLYSDEARKAMVKEVNNIYKASIMRSFAAQKTTSKTLYIDPSLYNIPISVGDRANTVQDASCALIGTHFPVEGDAVRLFMQWGKGLPSQHLDMDLSCRITMSNGNFEECSYFHLTCRGAKHSGDIQHIPNKVGTAEYIELSLPELEKVNAKYVAFTCNAYSHGTLSPNMVMGWMDSANPMKISEETGVAYDPSCVQHMVRISESNLSKGLVFGVLDVAKREIIWLEMPFTSQTVRGLDSASIEALLHKLGAKLSIGQLLDIKAQAQHLTKVETPDEADEAYTYEWALNPAEVTKLLYREVAQ